MVNLPEGTPYATREAALLFKTGSNRQMDVMVTIAADEAVRIQRIMERDAVSEQQVRDRMGNQWPQEEKIKHSDFVIRNNPGDFLLPQVWALHRALVGR